MAEYGKLEFIVLEAAKPLHNLLDAEFQGLPCEGWNMIGGEMRHTSGLVAELTGIDHTNPYITFGEINPTVHRFLLEHAKNGNSAARLRCLNLYELGVLTREQYLSSIP